MSTDAARKLAEAHECCPDSLLNPGCEECPKCGWKGHAAIDAAVSAAREEERVECQRIPGQIRLSPEAMGRFADNFDKYHSLGNAIAYALIECEGRILKRRSK